MGLLETGEPGDWGVERERVEREGGGRGSWGWMWMMEDDLWS
jgi:hypothetical protein